MLTQVISNQALSAQYYKLTLAGEQIAAQAKPGQFVMLQVNTGYDPLLRRPFSLYRWRDNGEIDILYKVVGKGTALMSRLAAGTTVDVLGPLGRGFCLPAPNQQILLVAGAVGVAPLLAWADELLSKHNFSPEQILILAGGQTHADILTIPDLNELGIGYYVVTEDGSSGQTGLVTKFLEEQLQKNPSPIFACGPQGMLKAVALLSRQYNAPCQLSMEALMACGVGACQGCVVKTRNGEAGFTYQRVCCEGPVFEAQEIVWE